MRTPQLGETPIMWLYLHPSQWRMSLASSMLVSAIIHLILVLILPGFTPGEFISAKPYIEINLLPPPQLIKKQALPASPKKKKRVEARKWRALAPRLPGSSQYYPAKSYQSPVKLPTAINKEEVVNLLPEEAFSVDELFRVPFSARPLTPTAPATTGVPEGSPQPTSAEINWSGPPRRYLYKPQDPRYSSRIEGEVKLKFWVDPQGNVTNVVVLKKLDAQLERLAIDYMKRWRFEPLKEKKQELQWGTIDIKFRLE